ncbi:flagellar brake protein [Limnobacter parvus]|uniref:Flagellar brake protein n=1 Tax=Limnobacter parvus TaxID=2939690 RepID=A0ABT1XDV3_9BURK|nr:flagellar brake protein [Limnobacter parvus]MCR2745466.1 flagellar brake protein [Limnobacter parvus]
MSQNTSIAPERDQKLLQEFSLSAVPTVRKLLNSIDEDEHEIYVYLQADHTQFVTEVLNIDWSAGLIWLGTPYEKALSANCGANTAYVMVSFPDGVKVQFAGIGILQSEYQNAGALRIAIPKSIVRLQRRNYFRVMADDELNSQVKLEVPSTQGTASLIDISLAGCGFTIPGKPSCHKSGDVLKDVRLTLPDGEGSMLVELTVRNVKGLSDDADQVQLGCEMKTMDRGAERRLQRFLLATERRQRSSLHSID